MAELSEPGVRPEPAFEAPWHAQVFALTVALNEAGQFTWRDWAARFGATLRAHGAGAELNGGDDYFAAWIETLEGLMIDAGAAGADEVCEVTEAWRRAYLDTPHGAPVSLGVDYSSTSSTSA